MNSQVYRHSRSSSVWTIDNICNIMRTKFFTCS